MWFVMWFVGGTLVAHAGPPRRKAAEQLRADCKAGTIEACLTLAEAHATGNGKWLPRDPGLSRQYLQKACGFDDAASCIGLATSLEAGVANQARSGDRKRVMDLYERACALGDQGACADLSRTAEAWAEPLGLSPQLVRLRHQTACEAGASEACTRRTLVEALDLDPGRFRIALDTEAAMPLHRVLAGVSPSLRECYRPKLEWNHRMVGRLGFRLALTEAGAVSGHRTISDSVNDADVETCIVDQLTSASFPPAQVELRVVEVHFDLKQWGAYVRPLETAAAFADRCDAGDTDACSHLAAIEPPAVQAHRAPPGTRLVAEVDRWSVGDVIGGKEADIHACYAAGIGRDRTLGGEVTFRVAIDHTGAVATAIVERSTLDDGGVESCLLRLIRAQTFSAPEGGGIAVATHSIRLDPELID